jgi:general secretion pathway protein J
MSAREDGFTLSRRSAEHGFTLIEMLVALAIFSLAALALLRLEGATVSTTARLREQVVAQIVARNIAVEALTDPAPPAFGTTGGEVTNGGRSWRWSRARRPLARAPDPADRDQGRQRPRARRRGSDLVQAGADVSGPSPLRHPGLDPGSMNTASEASRPAVFMDPDFRQDDGRGQDDVRGNGFTLVELLVSLLIFAMLSAAGVTLLRFSVSAQDVAEARLGRLGQLRKTGALLAGDLAQAVPRLSRDEAGAQRPAFAGASGEGDGAALTFVRLGVENGGDEPRSSLRKIEYRLAEGSLQRRSWAYVDGAAPSAETQLLDGVRRIRLRYRDSKGEWRGPLGSDPRGRASARGRIGDGRRRGGHGPPALPDRSGSVSARLPARERGAALLAVLLLVAVMGAIAASAFRDVAPLDRAREQRRLARTRPALCGRDRDPADPQGRRSPAVTRRGSRHWRATGTGWSAGSSFPARARPKARSSDGGNCFNLNSLGQGEDPADLTPRPAGIAQFAA